MENELIIEPANFYGDEHIFDIDFHPSKDFICCGTIDGKAKILQYTQDDTIEVFSKEVNKTPTRVCRFSYDGNGLITANTAGSIAFQDESGKVKVRMQKVFNNPIYSLLQLNENIIAAGDDDGCIKIFDIRNQQEVYSVHEQDAGTVSDMDVHSSMHYLLCTNTNGTLGVYDLRVENHQKEKKQYALSDMMEDDLNCISLVKNEEFVITGSEGGVLNLFKWDWFGDSKDRIVGHPEPIETIVKFNERLLLTGCSDGWVRIVSLFPNSVKIFQNHADDIDEAMPITKIELSRCKKFLASISHDNCIKFYDISEILTIGENDGEGLHEDLIEEVKIKPEKLNHTAQEEANMNKTKSKKQEKKANAKAQNIEFFDDM